MSTPEGGPGAPQRRQRGVRVTVGVLALLCMLLGPVGCLNGIAATQSGEGVRSAAEWYTLGVGAAVGLPLLCAAIATVADDPLTARLSLVLLLWPVVFASGTLLLPG
ncbi:hypothetical protein ACQEU5_20295 [Marinactinospora thermotolerans]|uniref:Uncharacterized protein n=1 Tax=Marinactinospora thermotolerans DSM 45154 TaxID=1122192 RepID=A0A1T4PU99_9ACTN|nr:hypothetical protein [Marinactinospora thermotolerans]SJZ95120.1 hypothetical protein SAMN02745673_02009 [Marinactinospora thermotolerans DSM 45154]